MGLPRRHQPNPIPKLLIIFPFPCPSVCFRGKKNRSNNMEEEQLTFVIRGCVYEVFRELGAGFLEQVYQRALVNELTSANLKVEAEKKIEVLYKGTVVGEYIADILVEGRVLIELKAVAHLSPVHEAQLLNYLKATGIKVGLLINFAHPKAQIKRFVV